MSVSNRFFEQPILNSPYKSPIHNWKLNEEGQPAQSIIGCWRRYDLAGIVKECYKLMEKVCSL